LNHYITGFDAGVLICLTVENVFLPVGRALIYLNFDDFLFLHDLFTLASLALIFLINNLTLPMALIAGFSALRVHARPKLLHDGSHTATLTHTASRHSARFTSLAIALVANAVSSD
jgi:hypothetical protein